MDVIIQTQRQWRMLASCPMCEREETKRRKAERGFNKPRAKVQTIAASLCPTGSSGAIPVSPPTPLGLPRSANANLGGTWEQAASTHRTGAWCLSEAAKRCRQGHGCSWLWSRTWNRSCGFCSSPCKPPCFGGCKCPRASSKCSRRGRGNSRRRGVTWEREGRKESKQLRRSVKLGPRAHRA